MNNELNKQEENKTQNNSNAQSEGGAIAGLFAFLIILGIGYFTFFKAIPFVWNSTTSFIGDVLDKEKKSCKSLVNDVDKITSLEDFNNKTRNKEIYSMCESKHVDISKIKSLGEKLEKEERDKKEQEEKELAKKKAEEEKQKNIESCKNNGGQWLDYSNKCKTKAEIDEEKENYRKDCLTKSNYTWDGNSCIGKEWFWQGNDRSLNSDSRVSSNESKIVNEVFNAVERKSKSAYVLDSGDGRPWTVTIKMNGDSLSDYTVVFYIEGNGNVYRVIVKNGTIIE